MASDGVVGMHQKLPEWKTGGEKRNKQGVSVSADGDVMVVET